MIKKISVEKLQLGMYVCGTDRKWIDLPFFRSKFQLTSAKEIATLQHYCKQVLIDTEKGRDEELVTDLSPPIISPALEDTFDFDTAFDVVELSSGELALIHNKQAASGLYLMTDASKQLLTQAYFVTLDDLAAQGLEIAKLLAQQDPLCELLMAVYARTQEA
jgi:hypothetical protein